MNRQALERAAYKQPMLVGDGFVFKNFDQFSRERREFLDNPKFLIQFIRTCEFLEEVRRDEITDWHRENDAYASRLIPLLTWEYKMSFNYGPLIAAIVHCGIETELPEVDSIEPIIGLDPSIFALEMEYMERLMRLASNL